MHTKKPPGVGTAGGDWLQPKFLTLYSLKTFTRPTSNACFSLVTAFTNALLVFHWPWLTLTQCLFCIGHILSPRVVCFPVITFLFLSTAWCVCQLHPPGLSPVKIIYYSTRHFLNIQGRNLAIRWFNLISETLAVGWGLTPRQICSGCILGLYLEEWK